MDEKQFKEIASKLDLITRLLALNITKDSKSQKGKILMLSSFGLGPTNIAELLGTTVNTVNVALSRARKEEDVGKKVEPDDKQGNNETSA